MFAVIKTGGKQYRVAANDRLRIDRLAGDIGDTVVFEDVLVVGAGADVTLGSPLVKGASVAAEVLEQGRDATVIAFKKRRRQNSKRRRGHRQLHTIVQISEILTGGAKPSKSAKPAKLADTGEGAAAPAKPAKAETAVAAAGELDSSNLSLISGIGPTIEKKLREAGITNWQQIAAWNEADIAKWDEELALRGRATREEWVEQAKELLDGKPPRAKVDQAEKASGKDL